MDGEQTEVAPAPAEVRLSSGARRWLGVLIALAVVLALAVGGLMALRAANRSETEDRFAAAQREVTEQANVGSWPDAKRALDDQAAALVRGDEKGWLAAVDPQRPQLREQYRRMFANLRQLGVTAWSYNVFIPPVTAYGRAELGRVS